MKFGCTTPLKPPDSSVDSLISVMQEQSPSSIPIGYRTVDNALIVNPEPGHILRWAEIESLYCITTPTPNSETA